MPSEHSTATTDPLTLYSARVPPSRPRARAYRWLRELHEAVAAFPDELRGPDAVDRAMDVDLRRYFFMLEGLFRIYCRSADRGRGIEKALKRVKQAEDALGRVDYARAMRDAAREVKLPMDTMKWLAAQVGKSEKALAKLLDKRWRSQDDGIVPGIAKLVRHVEAAALDDFAEDRAFLAAAIDREMSEVGEGPYRLDELEAGVHELRRDIRWFPIYCTALDGVMALDSTLNPIEAFEPLLQDPAAESKYAQLAPHPDEPNPIALSRSLYIANTKYIGELGDLKDRGQLIEGLAHALRESGAVRKRKKARERALEALDLTMNEVHFIHERAKTIWAEMVATDFWNAFRAPLAAVAEPITAGTG